MDTLQRPDMSLDLPQAPQRHRRPWIWIIATALATLLFLGAAFSFGASTKTATRLKTQVNSANVRSAALLGQISSARQEVSDISTQLSQARVQASDTEIARHTCYLAAQALYDSEVTVLQSFSALSAAGIGQAQAIYNAHKAEIRACIRGEGSNGFS